MTATPEPCREPDCPEPGTLTLDVYYPAADGSVRSPLRLTRGAYCLPHAAALLAAGDARPLAMGHVYGLDPEAQHLARVGPVGDSVSFDAYRCQICAGLFCAHCQQDCPGEGADADTLRTLRAMTTHGETACADCGGPLELVLVPCSACGSTYAAKAQAGKSFSPCCGAPLQLYEIDTPATLEAETAALARMGRCDACGCRAPELWARDDRARCGPCALEDLVAEGLIRLVQEGGR